MDNQIEINDINKKKSLLERIRPIFTVILVLNLIFLIERSLFDFLGFMFGMILMDILNLIFIIVGFFGIFQYRVNYIVTAVTWSLLWLGWNCFVICTYLNIGLLNKNNPVVLNLNTGQRSWWLKNNFSCPKIPLTFESYINSTQNNGLINESNCYVPHDYIEIIHSSVLIFFSILKITSGLIFANALNVEDDAFDYIGGFDTTNIINLYKNEHAIKNSHIRLEPLYVTGAG